MTFKELHDALFDDYDNGWLDDRELDERFSVLFHCMVSYQYKYNDIVPDYILGMINWEA